MAFEPVSRLSELPTQCGRLVRVGELEIGLYRVGDQVYAMDDACPHAGFPLHEGRLDGEIVTCNGHGWEYDVTTGKPPDAPDERPICRYRVRIEADQVLVDPEDRIP